MPSGLRAKLNALGASAPKVAPVSRPSGVLVRTFRQPADEALFSLDSDGLRRIGWNGGVFRPERCAFIDTETTGLSGGAGTVAFLVGIGRLDGHDFTVTQFLMRDYPDEAEMLQGVLHALDGCESVCTFNGNKFDLPLLRARFSMCRMRVSLDQLVPLDLLHPARRTWKLRIGSCRLSQIEEKILGCPRESDLPGSEVPQRYFEYLKSGDLELLEDIIDHNRRDIITLSTLLCHLCGLYASPEEEKHPEDLFSMGKALERQGELGPAMRLYRIAAVPASTSVLPLARKKNSQLAAEASWRMYLLERKNRNYECMRDILERMATRGQMTDKVFIELSKLYEHRLRDPRKALRYARIAQRYIAPEDADALQRRIDRLNRKIQTERKEQHGPF